MRRSRTIAIVVGIIFALYNLISELLYGADMKDYCISLVYQMGLLYIWALVSNETILPKHAIKNGILLTLGHIVGMAIFFLTGFYTWTQTLYVVIDVFFVLALATTTLAISLNPSNSERS
jgi:hypothetical protein